jgi:hypothetical protein
MPGARRTRSLACKVESTRVSHHRFAEHSGIPCAMVYGLLRDLPGDRALLPPSPRNAKHCRELTPASRRQDHTTSPSATHALVSRACRVHRTPHPTFVTTAKRPSYGRGAAGLVDLICPTAQGKRLRHVGTTGKSVEGSRPYWRFLQCKIVSRDAHHHLRIYVALVSSVLSSCAIGPQRLLVRRYGSWESDSRSACRHRSRYTMACRHVAYRVSDQRALRADQYSCRKGRDGHLRYVTTHYSYSYLDFRSRAWRQGLGHG